MIVQRFLMIALWRSLFLVLAGCWLVVPAVRADSPVEAQAFPYQSGFPRTEPGSGIAFASPSVVDLNKDGVMDVLIADGAGCIWGWNAQGKILPGFPWKPFGSCSGTPRIEGPLAIGDVDGDGTLEVVAGTRGLSNNPGQLGRVFIWKANGSLLPGWPKEMVWNFEYAGTGISEVGSVALANVSGDARLEIIAGTSNNSSFGTGSKPVPLNLYVWDSSGLVLPGFPTGYRTAGVYGLVGAANLVGDDHAEVITGRDHLYMHAYGANGQYLPGWPVQTYVDPSKVTWNKDPYVEFTNNAPAMGDLDGDGQVETVIAGKVKSPQANHDSVNSAVMVIEPNGQRRAGWKVPPLGGDSLANSFQPDQAPALADLDGDGKLEIVVALFDGIIRAFRENGTLIWQYNFAQGQILYSSEPVIGDVTGDGRLDIIFGTYSPDGSAKPYVSIMGLDASGQPLPGFPLPLTKEGTSERHGVRAAPTLTDLDRDCDLEILAISQAGVLYAWDLPFSYDPGRMPWPTGRHDNYRSGNITQVSTTSVAVAGTSARYKVYLPVINRCQK